MLDGKTIVGKVSKKVSAGKNTSFTVAPTAAGKRLIAKKKKGIKVKLTVLVCGRQLDVRRHPTGHHQDRHNAEVTG